MYIKSLSAIIYSHSITHHSFVDDIQVQMSATPDGISELLNSMRSCMRDVKLGQLLICLSLITTRQSSSLLPLIDRSISITYLLPLSIGNGQFPFKQSVQNLGFTLDYHLTMNVHVSNIARTCYLKLRRLKSIRRFLTFAATATLLVALALSTIIYCISLLLVSTHDMTSNLQRIQT